MAENKKNPQRLAVRSEPLIAEICTRIALGEPLRQICREEGMPHWTTFYDWLRSDNELFLRFAQARELGFDAIAEETLEIADDASNDWMEKNDKDGNFIGYVLNGEHVQRSKLRIETRLKLLAKWSPNKYGDKVEISGIGGQNGQQVAPVYQAPELTKEEWLKAHGIKVIGKK
jgi:hypothetical protein